jgi:hypothetical protein
MTRWKRSKSKPFWPRERPPARGLQTPRETSSKSGRRQRWREEAQRVLKNRA